MSLTTYRFGIVDDGPGIAPSAATSAYPPKAKRRELSGVAANDTPPERGGYILPGSFAVVVVVAVVVLVVVGEDEDEDDDEEYVSGESRSIHSAEYSRRCLVMARLLDVVILVVVVVLALVVVVVVAAVRIGVIATTTCERQVVGKKP